MISDIINELQKYSKIVHNYIVFHGDTKYRITPRGILSENCKRGTTKKKETPPKTTKTKSKFLTIAREIKCLLITMFSMMYLEIVISIIYIHHRAYELRHVIKLTNIVGEKINSLDKESEEYIKRWIHKLGLYTQRLGYMTGQLESISPVVLSDTLMMKNVTALRNQYIAISGKLQDAIQSEAPRSRPITFENAEQVICMKQEDFEYPFGMALFELAYVQHKTGQGYPRLEKVIEELKEKGHATVLPRIYATLRDKFRKDITESLIPSIKQIDKGMAEEIEFTPQFVNAIRDVLVDFVICLSIHFFHYGLSVTNHASGTKIQLMALNTVLTNLHSNILYPLPPNMILFFREITRKTIELTRKKKPEEKVV